MGMHEKGEGKGKSVPVHMAQANRGSRGTAPLILKLDARRKEVSTYGAL
jgi:hypothetical protein